MLEDNPHALLISVNREVSTSGHNWYALPKWRDIRPIALSSLPLEIQHEFTALGNDTVGAFATGHDQDGADIQLYLINIPAIKETAGKPGSPVRDFTTTLANQTILLRTINKYGADVYLPITKALWSTGHVPPRGPSIPPSRQKSMDGLIANSELALDPPDPPDPSVITCYLLNLASFTDPQTR